MKSKNEFSKKFSTGRHAGFPYSAAEWRYLEKRKTYLPGPDGWYWAPAPLEITPQEIEHPVEDRLLRQTLEAFTRSWEDLRSGPDGLTMRRMNKIYRDLK